MDIESFWTEGNAGQIPNSGHELAIYSSNEITKKEPKSDARLSKFDWHDLSPIFLARMLLHNKKVL